MATMETDQVSGQTMTGHEWDGIKELNTPLPLWWVLVFWVTIIWSIAYWIAYPSWPTLSDYTKGVLGYSSRAELEQTLAEAKADRSVWMSKFENASLEEILNDKQLLNYALVGGKFVFAENCAPCHGSGGAGAPGYPTLVDDEWIWGGSIDAIQQTIAYGVRNDNMNSRISAMPNFGADGLLSAEEIDAVADYVVALSSGSASETMPGAAIFAEQCSVCHGAEGEGIPDLGAPPLNNQIWLYKGGKDGVVAQVTQPTHGTMPAWSERLDDATIKQLAVYVYSLGGGQ